MIPVRLYIRGYSYLCMCSVLLFFLASVAGLKTILNEKCEFSENCYIYVAYLNYNYYTIYTVKYDDHSLL